MNRIFRRNGRLRPAQQHPAQNLPEVIQPLAFQISSSSSSSIDPQLSSPLFSVIPQEIRDQIFEYALTAYPDPTRPYAGNQRYARPGVAGHPRIATELLGTCKAVYLETYQLPITLNPVIVYHDESQFIPPHARRGMLRLRQLNSWQLSALHMLDMSLQQAHLERNALRDAAIVLRAEERYEKAMRGLPWNQRHAPDLTPSALPGTTTPVSGVEAQTVYHEPPGEQPEQNSRRSGLEMPSRDPNVPRVIDKLTLRLGRTEWWTWEDPPLPASSATHDTDHPQLALDPELGDGSVHRRPTTLLMLAETSKRRQGEWQDWSDPQCWGAQVAAFKGLKELVCIFETFAQKAAQLDTIVDCAKTWRFPMGDGYDLRWDGHSIEQTSWMGGDGYGYEGRNQWLTEHVHSGSFLGTEEEAAAARAKHARENPLPDHKLFQVRSIRFVRRRCD